MLRRLPIIALAIVLVLSAFSSGLPFLFYLLYLASSSSAAATS